MIESNPYSPPTVVSNDARAVRGWERSCTVFGLLHMFLVAIATLAAMYVVESIVFTGAACSVIALPTLFLAFKTNRQLLMMCTALTLIIAAGFVVIELVLFLYPAYEAALGLCVIFLVFEVFTIVSTLTDIRRNHLPVSSSRIRLTIVSLIVGTAVFSISILAVSHFPTEAVPNTTKWQVAFRFPWMPALSLAMFLMMNYALISTLLEYLQLGKKATA